MWWKMKNIKKSFLLAPGTWYSIQHSRFWLQILNRFPFVFPFPYGTWRLAQCVRANIVFDKLNRSGDKQNGRSISLTNNKLLLLPFTRTSCVQGIVCRATRNEFNFDRNALNRNDTVVSVDTVWHLEHPLRTQTLQTVGNISPTRWTWNQLEWAVRISLRFAATCTGSAGSYAECHKCNKRKWKLFRVFIYWMTQSIHDQHRMLVTGEFDWTRSPSPP